MVSQQLTKDEVPQTDDYGYPEIFERTDDLARERAKNHKRVPMEEDQLKRKLFDCFSKKPQFTTKQLAGYLAQPDQHLKKVLREIADVVEGKRPQSWELKPQFK